MTVSPPLEFPVVDMLIEVPRGSFVKRDGRGKLEFISPVPCPFNYGSVPGVPAGDGDALDAVLLGPRLAAGQQVLAPVRAVIRFIDDDQRDDKLICAQLPLSRQDERRVLNFFRFYGLCKRFMNHARGRHGLTGCQGWGALAARGDSFSRR